MSAFLLPVNCSEWQRRTHLGIFAARRRWEGGMRAVSGCCPRSRSRRITADVTGNELIAGCWLEGVEMVFVPLICIFVSLEKKLTDGTATNEQER